MVFALNIIQSVPRVMKWTQAWPWHASLCDHDEAAILAHSHTIRKAQSLYQDLCLLAYWVIHQESAGVLHLQPWKKELPAFTFIIGVKIFSKKGTSPLANYKIVYVLHRIITYYLSYLRGWSDSPQHQQHLQECYYQQKPWSQPQIWLHGTFTSKPHTSTGDPMENILVQRVVPSKQDTFGNWTEQRTVKKMKPTCAGTWCCYLWNRGYRCHQSRGRCRTSVGHHRAPSPQAQPGPHEDQLSGCPNKHPQHTSRRSSCENAVPRVGRRYVPNPGSVPACWCSRRFLTWNVQQGQ